MRAVTPRIPHASDATPHRRCSRRCGSAASRCRTASCRRRTRSSTPTASSPIARPRTSSGARAAAAGCSSPATSSCIRPGSIRGFQDAFRPEAVEADRRMTDAIHEAGRAGLRPAQPSRRAGDARRSGRPARGICPVAHALALDGARDPRDERRRHPRGHRGLGAVGRDRAGAAASTASRSTSPTAICCTSSSRRSTTPARDGYGGDLEGRTRFAREVLAAVRERVGEDFVVGIRIVANEFHPQGLDAAALRDAIAMLRAATRIDFLDLAAGGYHNVHYVFPSAAMPYAWLRDEVAAVKAANPDIPVFGVGRRAQPRAGRGGRPRRHRRHGRPHAGADRRPRPRAQAARGPGGRHPALHPSEPGMPRPRQSRTRDVVHGQPARRAGARAARAARGGRAAALDRRRRRPGGHARRRRARDRRTRGHPARARRRARRAAAPRARGARPREHRPARRRPAARPRRRRASRCGSASRRRPPCSASCGRTGSSSRPARSRRARPRSRSAGRTPAASPRRDGRRVRRGRRSRRARPAHRRGRRGRHRVRVGHRAHAARGGRRAHPDHAVRDGVPARRRRATTARCCSSVSPRIRASSVWSRSGSTRVGATRSS